MKATHHIIILAAVAMTACTKTPEQSSSRKIEERLDKLEAQLSRIEAALKSSSEEVASEKRSEIKIYLSGEVSHPGQYTVDKDISLLAALAVAGGPTQVANLKKVKISKTGQEDQIVSDKDAFKDVILAEGDTVVVPQSFW